MSPPESSVAATEGPALPTGWTTEHDGRFTLHTAPRRDHSLAFERSIARGLASAPKTLEARYLYDAIGSELYERITEQPEYYLTNAEDGLLQRHAHDIRALVGDVTLIELGSGSSTKTRRLLDAGFQRYVAIDISGAALRSAGADLCARYPELTVEAFATTYDDGLTRVRHVQPAMLCFMGSSLGNLDSRETDAFFEQVAESLQPGGYFLLGVDLVKDAARLEAAYDDAAGWTRKFTKNLFTRMNAELGTDIGPDDVEHVSFYNDVTERIEIFAELRREVFVTALGQRFRIAKGERISTEVSRKYRPHQLAARAVRFGLELVEVFSDGDFADLLFRRGDTLPARDARNARGLTLLDHERRHTLKLIDGLSEAQLCEQHDPLMSPVVWDLAHIAAFERLWAVQTLGGVEDASLPDRFNPDLNPRHTRGSLELPDRAEVLALLDEVRAQTTETVKSAAFHPLLRESFLFQLVAQHEAQHTETLLQAIQLCGQPYAPGLDAPAPIVSGAAPDGMVHIPGGWFLMGTDDRSHAYDNERPAHWVEVAAFDIDRTPVTNDAYLGFVEAGGYDEPQYWSEAGWAWRSETGATAPQFWQRTPEGWQRSVFGHAVPLEPDHPVVHVCFYEAEAYARWSGKRLPTEAEWEKAAAWDDAVRQHRPYPWGHTPPDGTQANLGAARLNTTAVGSWPAGRSYYGCHQMLGDVWEWTSTVFEGYPDFEAYPYPEYSEVFFDKGYRVLRGGSFVTREAVARTTFRNWDWPQRRQIFAGFRCARSR